MVLIVIRGHGLVVGLQAKVKAGPVPDGWPFSKVHLGLCLMGGVLLDKAQDHDIMLQLAAPEWLASY